MADRDGRPDPSAAGTAEEFVDALRRLKKWTGLGFRQLEQRANAAGQALPRSTATAALSRNSLPREDLVAALVRACGGDADEVRRWVAARRSIAATPPSPPSPPAPAVAQTPAAAGQSPADRAVAGPVRCTLPADQPVFVGRDKQLEQITAAVADAVHNGGVIAIHAIDGMPGIGKTTLAVRVAHRLADRFDRQLFVDLHTHNPGRPPVKPFEALAELLTADGVDPRLLPSTIDGRSALWRDRIAGRRLLLILDNAQNTAQVRPLLPGAPGCLVVVTSRNQLSGLVAADGACPVIVDLLTPGEARELLARRVGTERLAAEPSAVAEIVSACDGLPLALAIVAARAAVHPHLPLRTLAAGLRDASACLDTLTTDDRQTDVRAVFSLSYEALSPAAARLLRLLGLHPAPDTTARAAASLTGQPVTVVRGLLAELIGAHLLAEPSFGRYTVHDLVRAYAREQAHLHDTAEQRHAAISRVLDHYLHTAYEAARLLEPSRDPIPLTPPRPGVTVEDAVSEEQAMDWFTAEHAALIAVLDHAAASGFDTHTWQLATALWTFLDWRGHWHDQVSAQQAAAAAAERLADPPVRGHTHLYLARACLRLGRFGEARAQLRRALRVFRQSGDQNGQAHAHGTLSEMCERQNRPDEALRHTEQALHLYRAAGHRYGQAQALNNLGWFHAVLGDRPRALALCQEALALHQELGNRPGQANTWDSLGFAHHHLGEHGKAITCYRHALALFKEIGHRHHQAVILDHLGDTHHATGDAEAANDAWQQAVDLLERIEHPDVAEVRKKLTVIGTFAEDPG